MCAQEFRQSQKQTQSQVLAPQLRNSLKILQAPATELRTSILEELQNNPLLEELPLDSISVEDLSHDKDEDRSGEIDELNFDAEDFSTLDRLNEDIRQQFADENSGHDYSSEDEARREHFLNSLVLGTSLQQHLIQQAELTNCTESEREALLYLIGSLDDHGFLTESLSNCALQSRLPLGLIQAASERLKTFDPAGIGTADLRDCLDTQLTRLDHHEASLPRRILREHFNLLVRRRIPELTRLTGAKTDEIQDAIAQIGRLDPAPGKRFAPDSNTVVDPDVTVFLDEYDQWQVHLHNDYIPKLRINSTYKAMLAKGTLSKSEKEFLLERLRSGKFLINSIEQRQQTIQRITRELLIHQREFFEEGIAKLRPLTMNTVAQVVGVHETTISRATANKYIRTPHGTFPFKYFFTTGYKSATGDAVSNKSVQDMIAQLIEDEDPAKPLSDQAIVNLLQERDIKIARRTVAKYREALGILATNLRRRYE
ncbi:MAG: RNA polymerase factor sigma-54 [Opitutales bacterium]